MPWCLGINADGQMVFSYSLMELENYEAINGRNRMEVKVKEAKNYTIELNQNEKKVLLKLMDAAGCDAELIGKDFTEEELLIATKLKMELEDK